MKQRIVYIYIIINAKDRRTIYQMYNITAIYYTKKGELIKIIV